MASACVRDRGAGVAAHLGVAHGVPTWSRCPAADAAEPAAGGEQAADEGAAGRRRGRDTGAGGCPDPPHPDGPDLIAGDGPLRAELAALQLPPGTTVTR